MKNKQVHTKQKMQAKRLIAYSAQTAVCLGLTQTAQSQVVYTDLDPDMGEFTQYAPDDTSFYIDINADGINELSVVLSRWRSVTYYRTDYSQHVYLRNFEAIADQSAATGSVLVLGEGDVVGPGLHWDSDGEMLIGFNLATSSTAWYSSYNQASKGGPFMDQDAAFIGLQFLIGGDVHYGWVRLSVKSNFSEEHAHADNYTQVYVMDYAYNPIANTPITINPDDPIGVAKNVYVRDVFDTHSTSDIYVSFEHPDSETHIEQYRLMLVLQDEAEQVNIAEAMAATDYVVVATGEPVSAFFLPDGVKDMHGNDIQFYQKYCAIVLSEGNAASGFAHALSTPSFPDLVYDGDACAILGEVTIDAIAANNNISDYQVTFNAADFEETIDHYRIFIINSDTVFPDAYMEMLYLQDVTGFMHYMGVVPDGSEQYQVQFPEVMFDAAGEPIVGGDYYIRVLGVRNADVLVNNCVSDSAAVTFPEFTSIENIQHGNTISVYPNPANNFITIETSLMVPIAIQIRTISGQLIAQQVIHSGTFELDISTWPSGIYYLQSKTEKDIIVTQFIKQ